MMSGSKTHFNLSPVFAKKVDILNRRDAVVVAVVVKRVKDGQLSLLGALILWVLLIDRSMRLMADRLYRVLFYSNVLWSVGRRG